jgi:hypothetical protein
MWALDRDGNWLKENPLINAEESAKLIQSVHSKYDITVSYGGYGEDRSILWHDTYLDALKSWYHLGVDINVPAGTRLISPIDWEILVSDHDRDNPSAPQHHGWGNRLIIKPRKWNHALILAHLSDKTRMAIWSIIYKGMPLWGIWTSGENGGWFEHFHAQSIDLSYLSELIKLGNLSQLDGYALTIDTSIGVRYPDPMKTF